MYVKVVWNNSFQECRASLKDVKLNQRAPGGEFVLTGTASDEKSFEKSFEVRLMPDEVRVLIADFLDKLGEDEKTVRHLIASSYRKLLSRG